MKTTIQVRTKPELKKSAQLILEKLGLDLSTAINIFLAQIIEKKGIPFEVITANGLSLTDEKKILKEIEWAKAHGKRYTSTEEMLSDITT